MTSLLVIMVRGLFTKLQYPFAPFPSRKLTGDQMVDPFWEAVYHIERCTLKVVGGTFNGASPNRRFLMIHAPSSLRASVLHKVANPFADDGREIFLFSDPPYLIKTARNCFASKARLLWVSIQVIWSKGWSWCALIELSTFFTEQWQVHQVAAPG